MQSSLSFSLDIFIDWMVFPESYTPVDPQVIFRLLDFPGLSVSPANTEESSSATVLTVPQDLIRQIRHELNDVTDDFYPTSIVEFRRGKSCVVKLDQSSLASLLRTSQSNVPLYAVLTDRVRSKVDENSDKYVVATAAIDLSCFAESILNPNKSAPGAQPYRSGYFKFFNIHSEVMALARITIGFSLRLASAPPTLARTISPKKPTNRMGNQPVSRDAKTPSQLASSFSLMEPLVASQHTKEFNNRRREEKSDVMEEERLCIDLSKTKNNSPHIASMIDDLEKMKRTVEKSRIEHEQFKQYLETWNRERQVENPRRDHDELLQDQKENINLPSSRGRKQQTRHQRVQLDYDDDELAEENTYNDMVDHFSETTDGKGYSPTSRRGSTRNTRFNSPGKVKTTNALTSTHPRPPHVPFKRTTVMMVHGKQIQITVPNTGIEHREQYRVPKPIHSSIDYTTSLQEQRQRAKTFMARRVNPNVPGFFPSQRSRKDKMYKDRTDRKEKNSEQEQREWIREKKRELSWRDDYHTITTRDGRTHTKPKQYSILGQPKAWAAWD